jgi:hypothetical protein
MLHVSGAASRAEMHLRYYRGALNELSQSGHEMQLPPGLTAADTWCTGSDIWNENLVYRDAQGKLQTMPPVRCEASIEASYPEELRCDEVEQCLFSGGAIISDDRCNMSSSGYSTVRSRTLPPPVWDGQNFLSMAINPSLIELEQRYGTAPGVLLAALSTIPPNADVKLVEPSPLGQASLFWEEGGLPNVGSIDSMGGVVKWRGVRQASKRKFLR